MPISTMLKDSGAQTQLNKFTDSNMTTAQCFTPLMPIMMDTINTTNNSSHTVLYKISKKYLKYSQPLMFKLLVPAQKHLASIKLLQKGFENKFYFCIKSNKPF
jgi:hypothetical protein